MRENRLGLTGTGFTPGELRLLGWARRLVAGGGARELRLSSHLLAVEVARSIAISPQLVCDFEHGRRRPTGRTGLQYAEFLAQLEAATRV
jgi:hypothetical protein